MKKVFEAIFGKKVNINVLSMEDMVKQIEWAGVEVEDAKDALTGLQYRLQHGQLVMEDIAEEAQKVIERNQEILRLANQRRAEFREHTEQVLKIQGSISTIYGADKGEDN